MPNNLSPFMFQSAREIAPTVNLSNENMTIGEARHTAFNAWLSQISHMLDEWELELMGHSAPISAFETIAAFKDVLQQGE